MELYEALMSESTLGNLARSLVGRYPRTCSLLLWCTISGKEFRNEDVLVWASGQGLGIQFSGSDQILNLLDILDWAEGMAHLEGCLPPLDSMPGA